MRIDRNTQADMYVGVYLLYLNNVCMMPNLLQQKANRGTWTAVGTDYVTYAERETSGGIDNVKESINEVNFVQALT